MKKVLKFIGILILLVVAFFLIAGLFVKKEYHFERSVSINAPKAVVWEQVSTLGNQQHWSPWLEHDPNMQQKIEGVDGTVGAVHSWKGNKEVGSGSQTIKALYPMDKIETSLDFKEPYESHADAYVTLADEANGVKATWGFDSKFPYPMNAMMLFMNMDKAMDTEFNKGLAKLKDISEKNAAAAAAAPAPVVTTDSTATMAH
jgi:hypothetical protein